jgi:hypothetical protein
MRTVQRPALPAARVRSADRRPETASTPLIASVLDQVWASRGVVAGDVVVVDAGQGPVRVATNTAVGVLPALLGARPGQRVRWCSDHGPVLLKVIAIERTFCPTLSSQRADGQSENIEPCPDVEVTFSGDR